MSCELRITLGNLYLFLATSMPKHPTFFITHPLRLLRIILEEEKVSRFNSFQLLNGTLEFGLSTFILPTMHVAERGAEVIHHVQLRSKKGTVAVTKH